MISDCQRRLAKAYQELKEVLDTETDLNELEDYTVATQVLEEAKSHLPSY